MKPLRNLLFKESIGKLSSAAGSLRFDRVLGECCQFRVGEVGWREIERGGGRKRERTRCQPY